MLPRQHTSIVIEVEESGLGAVLGKLPGDRILGVQGWQVRASADIRRILDSLPGNGSLTVQVQVQRANRSSARSRWSRSPSTHPMSLRPPGLRRQRSDPVTLVAATRWPGPRTHLQARTLQYRS